MKRPIAPLILIAAASLGLNAVVAAGQDTSGAAKPEAAAPHGDKPAASAEAPSKALTTLEHAKDLYWRGRFDEARGEYEALSKSGPDTGAGYAGLARVLLKQKKVAEAEAAAIKAMEAAPDLSTTHSARGEVYFRQGKLAEAEKEFLAAAKLPPPDARALFGLVKISLATSNYKMAKARLEVAHRWEPRDPEIRREWLFTLSLEERLKALKEYLGSETNDDPEDRGSLANYVVVLEDRLGKAKHRCKLVTAVKSTQINLQPLMLDAKRIRDYGLSVNINGTGTKLLLDTGAGGIVVNTKVAEKAGLRRIVEMNASGIGSKGAASGYIANADSIKIGELEFQGCPVHVIDKKRALGDDGLIGADVFEDFLVDIDFPNQKFRLSELPPLPDEKVREVALASQEGMAERLHDRYIAPEMKDWERVFRFGHDLLIWTSVNNTPVRLFLLDTGAFDNLVSEATAREVSKVHGDSDMIVKGISGRVDKVYRTGELNIRFARFQQKRPDFVAFDLTRISDEEGVEVGGILGIGMLWLLEMKIDYRDGLVNFKYDENRFH